jgi:hypothetical protein
LEGTADVRPPSGLESSVDVRALFDLGGPDEQLLKIAAQMRKIINRI